MSYMNGLEDIQDRRNQRKLEDKIEKKKELPNVEEAARIAVSLSGNLSAQEQALFIAGFQGCIKYLKDNFSN